jgi:hypothetical protein
MLGKLRVEHNRRSGSAVDVARPRRRHARRVPRFLIHHRHEPQECRVAFVAFRGHDSTLRHKAALASCAFGDHAIWWTVDAASEQEALELLPFFVAERSTVTRVISVVIP